MKHQYWLMKSEPSTYSIDDLKRDKKTPWEGVRNYQARNFMMNEMRAGDFVLFYHSSAEPPGVAGVARVHGAPKPDQTQFDKKSDYYDPKSTSGKPRWLCVNISFDRRFAELISLEQIKNEKGLAEMMVLKKGQRLSVQPVEKKHFDLIMKMAKR